MLTLSKFVWPSTSNSTKSPSPTNVPSKLVAVTTPDIETLSKFVWPSTSKSPLASIFPFAVKTPSTVRFELKSAAPKIHEYFHQNY